MLRDVFDEDGNLAGRLATFSDGLVRAFFVPVVAFCDGSNVLNLAYCGMYKSSALARRAVISRAHKGA